MLNRNLITSGIVIVLGGMASIGRTYAATELARVNNTVITLEEFNKKYRENLKFFQLKPPTKRAVLDDLVKRELGIQKAKQLGYDKDPEVIDRMNTVLYNALLEKNLSKDFEAIQISDSEAQEYYQRNPEIRTSHIFIALRPGATPAEQKQAYDRIKKIYDEHVLPQKMSFAEVAQRFSEGPAALIGGDLDYQTRDRLDPAYYDAAVKLSPGKVSGIVRTQFGYHIIKLTAIHSWDEVDRTVAKRMKFEERRSQIFEKYIGSIRAQSKVATHPELIPD